MIKAVPFSSINFEPASFGPNSIVDYVPNVDELAYVPSLKKLVFITAKSGYDYEYVEVLMVPNKLYYHSHTLKLYYWDAIIEDLVETTIPDGESVSTVNMLDIIDIGFIGTDGQPPVPLEEDGIVVIKNKIFIGCTVVGNNTQIVATSDGTKFSNCFFTGTFCYSNLKATNFGCVDDLSETTFRWEYIGNSSIYEENVKQYGGTDNTNALTSIGQFCSGSDHVRIVFNGNFFSAYNESGYDNDIKKKIKPIKVSNAMFLELCGSVQPALSALIIKDEAGEELESENASNDANWALLKKLVTGFSLENCKNVSIHHISFIGFHSGHKFPPRYASAESFNHIIGYDNNNQPIYSDRWKYWCAKLGAGGVDDPAGKVYGGELTPPNIDKVGYTIENCFNPNGNNSSMALGMSTFGVTAYSSSNKYCTDIKVSDCNFSMRSNGVTLGLKSAASVKYAKINETDPEPTWHNTSRNMSACNCRCDHIYWQPIGFHCTEGLACDFYIDGCGQPIDISTLANHCLVENVVAKNCGCGPKQEANPADLDMSTDLCRSFTHDNAIRNCDIQINDFSYTVDDEQYIIRVARGASGSHFIVKDCKFDVYSRKKTFVGFMLEDENVTIRNTEFFIDVQTKWNLESNVKMIKPEAVDGFDGTPEENELEEHNRYIYKFSNGKLYTDIPKLFYGNKWQGINITSLALDNVVVHISENTSIEKAFCDLKSLKARDVKFVNWDSGNNDLIAPVADTTANIRKIYIYLSKTQSAQFQNCEFIGPTAYYFAHSHVTHLSMIGSKLGNITTFGFNYQTVVGGSDSITLELMGNEISNVTTLIFYNKTSVLFDLYCSGNLISTNCFFQGKLEPQVGEGDRTIIDIPPRLHIVNNDMTIGYTEAFRLEPVFALLLQELNVSICGNSFVGNRVNGRNDLIKSFTNETDTCLLRRESSHLFWRNTTSGTMNPINTGSDACYPLHPFNGMVFHEVDSVTIVSYMWIINAWVEVTWNGSEWVRVNNA